MTQLYEAVFSVRDGESEYSDRRYILAKGQKQAQKYFDKQLKEYWGSDTRYDADREEAWEKPFDCRCAELESVSQSTSLIVDNLETGGQSELRYVIWTEVVNV